MLKIYAVVHIRKKITAQDVEHFFSHHPYMAMLFGGIVMPILGLATVSAICYAVMLPVSFFMGWL